MNASALVQSPLKTSGSSPIGFVSWVRGTGHRLRGRLGPAGIGSPPRGGPPGGPGPGSPPPPPFLPPPPPCPPPPPGGPPPQPYSLLSQGLLLAPSPTLRA